jgi:hypothetical protein
MYEFRLLAVYRVPSMMGRIFETKFGSRFSKKAIPLCSIKTMAAMKISWYSELIFKMMLNTSLATRSKYSLAWLAYQNLISSLMQTVAVAWEALSTPFLRIA